MDNRPILQKGSTLGILVDSDSFDELISVGHQAAQIMLEYRISKPFKFVRSPMDTTHNDLKTIPQFEYQSNDSGHIHGINFDDLSAPVEFEYQMKDIQSTAECIHQKKNLSQYEKEATLLAFVQAVLSRRHATGLLVTDNPILLKYRLWLESHFPGCSLNIVTVSEATEIMDLFVKYRGKYYVSCNFECDKGCWYWLSFRTKIPYFHVGGPFINAFSNRFVYLLISVDEMGFQYYLGVNNDTMNDTMYHFNYFISLVTGVFDSLAITAKNLLDLKFSDDSTPMRTSLNAKAGKEFLGALKAKHQPLRNHINQYVDFIKLMYELRETVIHREMFEKTSFEFNSKDAKWKANFIRIDKDIAHSIDLCGDTSTLYDTITEWGKYKSGTEYFLEPFHFAKAATKKLIEFTNPYLQHLGFTDFTQQPRNSNDPGNFMKTLDTFKRDHLGF